MNLRRLSLGKELVFNYFNQEVSMVATQSTSTVGVFFRVEGGRRSICTWAQRLAWANNTDFFTASFDFDNDEVKRQYT